MRKHRLAIFASGKGSNAVNIMTYFKNHPLAEVAAIVTNNSEAGVIDHAAAANIPVLIISNEQAADSSLLLNLCADNHLDHVILAGYLRMIPKEFASLFDKRIINIHPSLLPKFGGKGMYGDHVHEAVIAAGEKESGITVHYVNAVYDEGEIIGQAHCQLEKNETVESLRKKIAELEKLHFPKLIEQTLIGSYA